MWINIKVLGSSDELHMSVSSKLVGNVVLYDEYSTKAR
jgi:hypothetical protein